MNRLTGTIHALQRHGSLSQIDVVVGNEHCIAMLLGAHAFAPEMAVTLLFSESEVSLGKNLSGLISMRNRLPVTVVAIESGELLSNIRLALGDQQFTAIITSGSCARLALSVGDQLEALIKANAMSVVCP